MASPQQILETSRESLSLLRDIENDLDAMYAVAYSLYNEGLLTESVRSEIHQMRTDSHVLETAMYTLLTSAFRFTLPVGLGSMADRVPRPVRRPDLPPANLGHPPAVRLSPPATGATYQVQYGSRVTSGVWAVVAVVAVAAVIAVAVVGVFATQELFTFLRETRRLREETRRYLGQLIDSQARLQLCLDAGRSVEECFDLVPQPKPPGADSGSGAFPWPLVLGTVVVAGAAYFFFSDRAGDWRERLLTE
jgi:hypothetical protein